MNKEKLMRRRKSNNKDKEFKKKFIKANYKKSSLKNRSYKAQRQPRHEDT